MKTVFNKKLGAASVARARPATLTLDSRNVKIADHKRGQRCAATYASIAATCPDSCALKNSGCYTSYGKVRITVRGLDKAAAPAPEDAALWEAHLVASAPAQAIRDLPLRLHVSGDARTSHAASILACAASTWWSKGGGPIWTYTHAWFDVPRRAWRDSTHPDMRARATISVLASCERTCQGPEALARGYAPAVVVDSFPNGARAFEADGVRWIPCPAQTSETSANPRTCVDCRLCWNAEALLQRKAGIAFAAHGPGRKRALTVLQ